MSELGRTADGFLVPPSEDELERLVERIPVRPVRVVLHCDKCRGNMEPTGMMRPTMPGQYEHECTECGWRLYVDGKRYPYIKYEAINE